MDREIKAGFFDLAIIALTIYVLGALVYETFWNVPKDIADLLQFLDYFICLIFIVEFFYRFYKADNKLKFLKWGWVDLLASIPAVDFFRIGRLMRLIRLVRVFRAFKSTRKLLNHLFSNKIEGTLASLSILALLMIIFSSIAILQVETDPASNIKSAEDAIWWTYSTITTVGYGDKYPITTEGRILAMILMTFGVGLFGTFTAFVASHFVSIEQK